MAHPIITLLPWVPPLVPHIIPPRYITDTTEFSLMSKQERYQIEAEFKRLIKKLEINKIY